MPTRSPSSDQYITSFRGPSGVSPFRNGMRYNLMPFLKGETPEGPRKEVMYWSDDGDLVGMRYDKWKLVFMEQRQHGFNVWEEPMIPLRVPKLIDLHADPLERSPEELSLIHISEP